MLEWHWQQTYIAINKSHLGHGAIIRTRNVRFSLRERNLLWLRLWPGSLQNQLKMWSWEDGDWTRSMWESRKVWTGVIPTTKQNLRHSGAPIRGSYDSYSSLLQLDHLLRRDWYCNKGTRHYPHSEWCTCRKVARSQPTKKSDVSSMKWDHPMQ